MKNPKHHTFCIFHSSLLKMVYSAGNYKFKDFIKIGLPMNIFMGIAVVIAITILF